MIEDSENNLWLASREGIVRISRASLDEVMAKKKNTLDCQVFDQADGLDSTESRPGMQTELRPWNRWKAVVWHVKRAYCHRPKKNQAFASASDAD